MKTLFSFTETFYYAILFAQRTVAAKKTTNSLDFGTVVALIIGFTVVIAVGFVAYYVISKIRKSAIDEEQPPTLSEHLSKFQEACDDGNMTTGEYATVKAHLSQEIMREVKQADTPANNNDRPVFHPK
ncbi:MAG: hypothetical protein LBJ67_16790 [Planctomycetaceae bacterium]|jgi:hypothetical protein|nr:hypothetical protein [Planctomycetaceae bacterium]